MSFDNNTKKYNYSTNDLIGFAKIGSFGPKSLILLQALNQLKNYEALIPILQKQLNDALNKKPDVVGKIQEVLIDGGKKSK